MSPDEKEQERQLELAKAQLKQYKEWLNDPNTQELLRFLDKQLLELLLQSSRVPKNMWDLMLREQEKGEVRGLLTARQTTAQKLEDCQAAAEGREPTKPDQKEDTHTRLLDLLDGLGIKDLPF